MHAPRFTVLVLCLLVAGGAGCRKAEEKSSDGRPTPTGGKDQLKPKEKSSDGRPTPTGGKDQLKPKEELDVAQLLQKGGKNWSSLEMFAMGREEIKAGEGFWIWPGEDKVWSTKDEDLVINLRWKKRADKVAASKESPVGAEIAGVGPGMAFQSYTPITGFNAAATQGMVDANFGFRHKGEGDVVVYLVADGKRPVSNLLRLKAKSAP